MKDPHHHCSSATMTGCLYDFTWCEEAISWQGTWSSIYMKWGQAAKLGRKSCTSALLIHLIGVTWHLCWQAQQTGQKLNKKARMNYILILDQHNTWRLAADWAISTLPQPENWGKWLFSFTWHTLDCICNPLSSLDSPNTSVNLNEFSERPSRWSGIGSLAVQGAVEGTGLVQPGEETALEGPNSSNLMPTRRLLRRWSRALYSDIYWERKRQWRIEMGHFNFI